MSEQVSQNATRRNLPTTNKMVDETLIELHSRKGVTLHGIYAFIMEKYAIDISKSRQNLIKKRIIALRDSQDLVNITGKGFIGHIKLVDKTRFIRKLNISKHRPPHKTKKPAEQPQLENPRANLLEVPVLPSQVYELETPILPSQVYELDPQIVPIQIRVKKYKPRGFDNLLDTPMVPNRSSTPIPDDFFPMAPHRGRSIDPSNASTPYVDMDGTPRTSSIPRRRRLLRRLQDE